jgi:hypothetical protein
MSSNKNRNHFFEWLFIIARSAVLLILAATSAILVYGFSFGWFSKMTENPFLIYLGCNLTVIITYIAIDWVLEKLLDLVSDEAIVSKDKWSKYSKEKKKLLRIIVGISVFLLIVTGTMSLWTSGEISNALVEKPQNEGLTQLAINQTESFDKSINSIDDELKLARNTERKRVNEAKREGHKFVKSAIGSGNKWQISAWYTKRSWLNTLEGRKWKSNITFRESVYKAIKDSSELVNIELLKVKNLEDAKLSMVTNGSIRKDTTLSKITGAITTSNTMYFKRFNNVKELVIALELLCMFLAGLFTYVLGVWREVYGKSVEKTYKGLVELLIDLSAMIVTAIATFGAWVVRGANTRLDLEFATSQGMLTTNKLKKSHKRQQATTSDNGAKKEALKPMSDKEPLSVVKYVDLKNEIDKSKKRWIRAMKSGDRKKATEIEDSDFLSLEKKGFGVTFDRDNIKVSVSKLK